MGGKKKVAEEDKWEDRRSKRKRKTTKSGRQAGRERLNQKED